MTASDAEMDCDYLRSSFKHATKDESSSCLTGLDLIKEHGKEGCEYLGFQSGIDTGF